jgi:anti-anti-sigma regulatory factor
VVSVSNVEDRVVRLAGDATIGCARDLHDGLAHLVLPPSGTVVVKVDELEALDVAGAQVLIAFRRAVGPERVVFEGWPKPIADVLAVTGMASLLIGWVTPCPATD